MWLSLCMDAPLIIDVRVTAIGSRDGPRDGYAKLLVFEVCQKVESQVTLLGNILN